MEPAWIAVFGTLGGVLLTALAGIATVLLNARNQHQVWDRQTRAENVRLRRSEQRAIFVQYLEAYQHWYDQIMRLANERLGYGLSQRAAAPPSGEDARVRFSRAHSEIIITGGPEVRQMVTAATQTMWDLEKAASLATDLRTYKEAVAATRAPRTRLQEAMRVELEVD